MQAVSSYKHRMVKYQEDSNFVIKIKSEITDFRLTSLQEIDSQAEYKIVFSNSNIELIKTQLSYVAVVAVFDYSDPNLFELISTELEKHSIRIIPVKHHDKRIKSVGLRPETG